MTAYILAGGNDRQYPQFGVKLAQTVGNLFDDSRPLRILSCPFATGPEEWARKYAARAEWFHGLFPDAHVEQAEPDTLIDQLAQADIVYFHGGAAKTLMAFMETIPNLEPFFKDKIVIGSSAGADYLSEAFYTCVDRQPMRGSGIVPQVILPHYRSTTFDNDRSGPLDWTAAENELSAFVGGEPITHIAEGEFIVVTKP